MKIEFESNQVADVVKKYLIPLLTKYSIFTFSGPLGAGKTTIIKEFLKQASVKNIIQSPTFNYLNEYETADGKKFHHFDLYRLKDLADFSASGFDEILNTNSVLEKSYSCIEWPKIINTLLQEPILQKKVCEINLNYKQDSLNSRIIELKNAPKGK